MIARHCIRLLLALAAVLVVLFVLGTGTRARAQERCLGQLRECYGFAAGRTTYWEMWVTGLDCEIDFADCVRRIIVSR